MERCLAKVKTHDPNPLWSGWVWTDTLQEINCQEYWHWSLLGSALNILHEAERFTHQDLMIYNHRDLRAFLQHVFNAIIPKAAFLLSVYHGVLLDHVGHSKTISSKILAGCVTGTVSL